MPTLNRTPDRARLDRRGVVLRDVVALGSLQRPREAFRAGRRRDERRRAG
jgi:hypothetical protein